MDMPWSLCPCHVPVGNTTKLPTESILTYGLCIIFHRYFGMAMDGRSICG